MAITVIVLNWQRPRLLKRLIVPYIVRHKLVTELIISHGKQETAFSYRSSKAKVTHLNHWGINDKVGLSRRFIAAKEASNETILYIDDDVLLFHSAISGLYKQLQKNPKQVHGVYGRDIKEDSGYDISKSVRGRVPIILTKCAMVKKEIVLLFFKYESLIQESELRKGKPFWNGEDIFLSLMAIKNSGELNLAYSYLCLQIPFTDGVAISKNEGHAAYRVMITNYFIEKLMPLNPFKGS